MADLPIACTLSADALKARRQGLLADLLQHAQSPELTADAMVDLLGFLRCRWQLLTLSETLRQAATDPLPGFGEQRVSQAFSMPDLG
jgi:hypothetical protein